MRSKSSPAALRIASSLRSRWASASASSEASGSAACGGAGQQEPRLQEREPGRHDQIVGGELEPLLARGLDEQQILLGERQDGDAGEIDLLPARELEQQVERALEPVEVDRERGLVARPVGLEIAAERRSAHESPPMTILLAQAAGGKGSDGVNRRTVLSSRYDRVN